MMTNMTSCSLISRKWIISMLGMYSCALMYVHKTGISVAIVRMSNYSSSNETSRSEAPRFDWNETLQGIILGALFYLFWIVPTIVGNFTDRFGGKWFAFVGVFGPCILMAMVPWAAKTNVNILIALQTLVGGFQGFTYPALFYLYVQWFNPEERSKANSGIQVGQSIGGALMYLFGGYLCQTRIGWPLVFYCGSIAHIPWILLWLYFAADRPPNVDYLEPQPSKLKIRTPWLAIIKSPAVWASLISKTSCSYGFYMFLTKVPAYLNQVHDMKIVGNGFINAVCFASYGVTSFVAPYISNYLIRQRNWPVLTTRKLFQAIAMITPAICLLVITFSQSKWLVILMLIMAMFSYGFFTGGEWTMASEYAPNFVGTVVGAIHILGFIMGFMAPYIVGIILDSNMGGHSLEFKWNLAFYISSAFYLVGYLVFHFCASVRQQYWDKI